MEGTPLLHARRPTYLGRRIASAIGVVVGIAGIICFAMLYGSRWQVCVLAGLGGIVALINFIEATNRKQAFAKGMMPQNNVAPMRIIGVLAVCVGMLVALTYTAIGRRMSVLFAMCSDPNIDRAHVPQPLKIARS
eukprot:TRINITY_DN7501_c0_g1_i5.p1 TRINITY_DN7501_c0_g1~~TRINITY_DN7501_c0_g1_i5.p1  ORF type:complete len:135 (+),score=11.95 TRINITY_DN7501_c0_g1_i5:154-558(+)